MSERDLEIAAIEKTVMQEIVKRQWIVEAKIDKIVKELPQGFVDLGGERFIFKKIIAGNVGILIPDEFDLMEQGVKDEKYPYINQADYIFSDVTTTQNISLMPLEAAVSDEEFPQLVSGIFSAIRKVNPHFKIISEEISTPDNSLPLISYFDVLIPTLDEEIYTFMGIASLEFEVFLLTITCPKEEYELWRPLCIGILKTLTLEREDEA
ncbi:hypothetical protein RyT2_18400 [Pseudolactococcus yaeyamensis]